MNRKISFLIAISLVSMGVSAAPPAAKPAAYLDRSSEPEMPAGGLSDNKGSDSCGLGWQVTQKKSFIATTTRATTNWVIHPSFGMTSGTMGCYKHEFVKKEIEAAVYASNNFDPLSVEMAQGQGEYITGFARTMGCDAGVVPALGELTQKNYQTIMGADKSNGGDVYKNVRDLIRQDAVLSASCVNAS